MIVVMFTVTHSEMIASCASLHISIKEALKPNLMNTEMKDENGVYSDPGQVSHTRWVRWDYNPCSVGTGCPTDKSGLLVPG